MNATTTATASLVRRAVRGICPASLLVLALGGLSSAYGQAAAPPDLPEIVTTQPAAGDLGNGAADADGDVITSSSAERVIPLYSGESRLINAPWPVKRIVVNNPNVADVEAESPRQVHIRAIAPGASDFV